MERIKNIINNALLSITTVVTFAFIGGFNYIGEKFNIDTLIILGNYIKSKSIFSLMCYSLLIYLAITKTSLKNYIKLYDINADIEKMKSKFEIKTTEIDKKIEKLENVVNENNITILEIKKQTISTYRKAKSLKNDIIPRMYNLNYFISNKIIQIYGYVLHDDELEKQSKEIMKQLDILAEKVYKD